MTPPDFEKMAHEIVMSVPAVRGAVFVLHREHIAVQLRLVWNARGAADRAALGIEFRRVMAEGGGDIRPEEILKALDR